MTFPRAVLLVLATVFCFAAAPAPAPPPPVTAAQAQQALTVLQDNAQRQALIDVLRTIAKATPKPAAKPPDTGLADQTVAALSASADELSKQISSVATAAAHTPSLWGWLLGAWRDPVRRGILIDATWKTIAIIACGLAAEWVLGRLLARPLRALSARPLPGDNGSEAPHRHAITLLRRLPLAIGYFVLELLKPALFAVIANLAMPAVVSTEGGRNFILITVNAYVICRAVMILARLFVAPWQSGLRLIAMPDSAAVFVHRWVRRLVIVAIFGPALEQCLLMLSMEDAAGQAMLKLIGLIVAIILAIMTLRCRTVVALHLRTHRPGVFNTLRNRFAATWSYLVLALIAALWIVWAFQIHNGLERLARLFIGTIAVLVTARLISILLLGGVDHGMRVSPGMAARYPGLQLRAHYYLPVLRQIVMAIVLFAALVALLEVWGLDALGWFEANHIGTQLVSALITIALLVVLAAASWEGLNILMERRMALLTRDAHLAQAARLRTLLPILRTMLMILILTVVGLTALSELGINIAPLLAGASIFGVALGFGSQKLVQDFITGLFLLLENTMQVGDWVTLGGVSGSVEQLSIRTIRLRAGDGSLHIIPFSSVTTVNNVNRGIGNASIGVTIAYAEDSDRVCELLKGIGEEMRKDPLFAPMIRSDVAIWGIDKVDASGVTISGQIECTDSGRWGVQREFNRRMKLCLQENAIALAMPVQSVVMDRDRPQVAKRPPDQGAETPTTRVESPPPSALGNTAA